MDTVWLALESLSDGQWGLITGVFGGVIGGLSTYVVQLRAQREAKASEARAIQAQVASEQRAEALGRQSELRAAYVKLVAWAANFVDDTDPDRIREAPPEAVSTVELDGPAPVRDALHDLQRIRRHVDAPDWATLDARGRLSLIEAVRASSVTPRAAVTPIAPGAKR